MQLYLFNPENDMALAYGGPYYMPPANACKMAADLSLLPVWYAMPHSDVLVADVCQLEWMNQYRYLLGKVRGVTEVNVLYNKVYPWGWSASLVHRLEAKGLDVSNTISSEKIDRMRHLSSRGTAVEVLRGLHLPVCVGESKCLFTLEECMEFVTQYPKVLLKAPWSGSGKGIQLFAGEVDKPMQGWINRQIRTQGYVVGEPFYDKVVDFAMEFVVEEGQVNFVGYSLFETDSRGIYKENILATDQEIEKRLSHYVALNVLMQIRRQLEIDLSKVLANDYEGYLGVDMMICRMADGYSVHPCVEINLRMNMGVVSRLLYDRFVYPGTTGRYVVEYYPMPGEALNVHRSLQAQYPLVVEDKKIRQGYLSLTPVFEDTSYQAYILIS